jgi:transcriptional regulator with XRE-family HTH domain
MFARQHLFGQRDGVTILTDTTHTNGGVANGEGEALVAMVAANVRQLRTRRGWSLAEAAAAASIGKSTWAQLETGQANPSLETMWAIARAFDVPVGALLGEDNRRIRVLRASEGTAIQSATHIYQVQNLLSLRALSGLDVTLLETEPEKKVRLAKPHHDGCVEHLLVLSGRIRVGPVNEEEELWPGDLVTFPGDVEHTYQTFEPGTRCLVMMEFR